MNHTITLKMAIPAKIQMLSRLFSITIVLLFASSDINAQIEYEKFSSVGTVNWSYIDKEDIKESSTLYTFEIFNSKKMALVSVGSDVKKFDIIDDINTDEMRIIYFEGKAVLIITKDWENKSFGIEFMGSNIWIKCNAHITYYY